MWRDLYSPDDGVALHHGGGSDYPAGRLPYSVEAEKVQLRAWEQYHLGKGWRGLAYGWGVGQTGTIYRIRGWAAYGAHTGDVDGDGIANNDEIIPLIFIGSGNHHSLTVEAQAAIVSIRRWVEDQTPACYLYGHQELKGTATECPGPKLMDYVTTHRYLEDEMVDRNTKADDGQAVLKPAFDKAVAAGVMSSATQPGGVAFNDELATFLDRAGVLNKGGRTWTKAQIAAIAAASAAGGATVAEVIDEVIRRLGGG
jgi:hypothetical protein